MYSRAESGLNCHVLKLGWGWAGFQGYYSTSTYAPGSSSSNAMG